MSDNARFETYVGNQRLLKFRFRQRSFVGFKDLSAANEIRLEVTRQTITGNVILPAIVVDLLHPDVDLENGRVAVRISADDVTAVNGSYVFSLTVDIEDETITLTTGRIEVLPRPGFSLAS